MYGSLVEWNRGGVFTMKKLLTLILTTALLLTACSEQAPLSEEEQTRSPRTTAEEITTPPVIEYDPHEIITNQIITNESLERFNADNEVYTLSVIVNAAGNANDNIRISHSGFSYIENSNRAVVGKVVSIEYDSRFDFESAVIEFEMADKTINSPRIFPQGEHSGELAGIMRFCLWRWSDEINMMYPIETTHDGKSLIVYAYELGDFYIADLDRFYYDMDLIPDGMEFEGNTPIIIPPNDPPAFTIPDNPPFTITIDEEAMVSRPVVEGYRNLGWDVYHNGREVLSRSAISEYSYTYFGTSPGNYEIYLSAFVNGEYVPISNVVTYTISDSGVLTVDNAVPVQITRVADSPEFLNHVIDNPYIITIDSNYVVTRSDFDLSGYGNARWVVYRDGKKIMDYGTPDTTFVYDNDVPGYYEIYFQGFIGNYLPISNIVSYVIN
jgi:hypothetical protein